MVATKMTREPDDRGQGRKPNLSKGISSRQAKQVSLYQENLDDIEALIEQGFGVDRSDVVRKSIQNTVEQLGGKMAHAAINIGENENVVLRIHKWKNEEPIFLVPAGGQSANLMTANRIRANWRTWVKNDLRHYELEADDELPKNMEIW